MRVLVIGPGGSGKSTLSRRLAAIFSLPLINLDAEYWHSGWVETPPDQWAERVDELIARDRWVMDGNYGGTMEARLKRAEMVVFMDLKRRVYLTSALWRSMRHHGQTRPDMSPGCPERFNWEFTRYLWRFKHHSRHRIVRRLDGFDGRLVVLKTRREANEWLRLSRLSTTPLRPR